jgi:hypothetical protein
VSETGEIAAFYTARLNETQQRATLALAAVDGRWDCWPVVAQQLIACCDTVPLAGATYQMLAMDADPEQVLRDIEADRAILARYEALRHPASLSDRLMFPALADVVLACIRDRAARFSAHPEYKPEWKP